MASTRLPKKHVVQYHVIGR